MFDLPFAALIVGGSSEAPEYLIERHSLQRISGAAAWVDRKPAPGRIEGEFVGVGDAIYNTADARWRGAEQDRFGARFLRWAGWSSRVNAASPTALSLSRLPGSGPEIESCAREWGGPAALLQGREATKENLQRALVGRPSILHFATHVLEPPNLTDTGMIALSVSANGREELLGATEIGGWNADAGLVVLSGCNSGLAEARPGEGLMGLTRAWLMAGSRAVVASTWRTPDDVGVFFQRFYRQLRNSPDHDPARALAAAQVETIRRRDWRSRAPFWAAYFVVGNY
jgi:CHAT domain-containing protein